MLYNIKVVYLHCVFHGIRFKVNEDWESVIDSLLFFYKEAELRRKFVFVCMLTHLLFFCLDAKEKVTKEKIKAALF